MSHHRTLLGLRGGLSESARVNVHGQSVGGAEEAQCNEGAERDGQQSLVKVYVAYEAGSGQWPGDVWLTKTRGGRARGRNWCLDFTVKGLSRLQVSGESHATVLQGVIFFNISLKLRKSISQPRTFTDDSICKYDTIGNYMISSCCTTSSE